MSLKILPELWDYSNLFRENNPFSLNNCCKTILALYFEQWFIFTWGSYLKVIIIITINKNGEYLNIDTIFCSPMTFIYKW